MRPPYIRTVLIRVVLGISIVLIGILLIPLGVLAVLIGFIWTIADKIIRLLEQKVKV